MIKKTYEKPTMMVVKLQQQTHILAGSIQTLEGPNSTGSGANDDDWYELE